LGGYVAGRLRTKWANTHTHEIFFRDTAHGFITWAVATVLVVAVVTSAAATAITGGVHAAATVASGASQGAATVALQGTGTNASQGMAPYNIDTLFRSARPDSSANTTDARAEAARILANGIVSGDIPTADRTYLAELVAARTGISPEDAQKRVDTAIAQAKAADAKARQAADTARKAASEASIYTALSMLVGAFIACIAAALGGQRRDLHA
jgi:parvulin-like peptidyl-prolyl isomerase